MRHLLQVWTRTVTFRVVNKRGTPLPLRNVSLRGLGSMGTAAQTDAGGLATIRFTGIARTVWVDGEPALELDYRAYGPEPVLVVVR